MDKTYSFSGKEGLFSSIVQKCKKGISLLTTKIGKKQQEEATLRKTVNSADRDCDFEEKLQESLGNLHKRGLIRYFTGKKELAEIIFNDISTMVNILRCIFHHELSEFKEYEKLKIEKHDELEREQYKEDVAGFKQHAIISRLLVKLLLERHKCTVGEDVVLELLSFLNIAFHISSQQHDDWNYAFIPYFLRDSKPPSALDEEKIGKCYPTTLSLHCNMKGNIPRTYFNELMVKLYGETHNAYINQKRNVTWIDGLSVSIGKHKFKLLMVYDAREKNIRFIIQANVEEIKGHRFLFHHVKFIVTVAKEIREARFEGLILEYELICVDCERRGCAKSCVWDIPERLKEFESDDTTINGDGGCEDLPCALLQPLPEGKPFSDRRPLLYNKI